MRLFHPNTLYLKQLLLKTIRFIPLNNGQDRLDVCLVHCLQTCYIDLHAWGPIEVVLGDATWLSRQTVGDLVHDEALSSQHPLPEALAETITLPQSWKWITPSW